MQQIPKKLFKNSFISVSHLIIDHRLLMTTLALTLSGCMGVYEGGFECPPGEGVGCKSISEVNELINKGELPNSDLGNIPISECEDCTSRGNHSSQDVPLSQEEPTLWIAPWALTETP